MRTKVTLRKKPISKGRLSLYLDFYPPIISSKTNKPTRREFLGLYIYKKGRNELERAHNENTLNLAKDWSIKRENEVNKPEIYTEFEKEQLRLKEQSELNFVEYFKNLAFKKRSSNHDNWMSAYNYLEEYTGGVLKFGDLSEKVFEDFKSYLLNSVSRKSEKAKLANNTAVSYFNKVKAALKQAFKDGLIHIDINSRIEPIKQAETRREFLSIEELNQLIKTPCNNAIIKKAAIFSALTGLRFGDIKKLTWSNVEFIENYGYYLKYEQEKTGAIEMHPISAQAIKMIEPRGGESEKLFEGLRYSAYENKHLYQWIGAAGITKNISFHNFRHTYATLQLASGTDIYTISKLLGHKSIKTTQIYAKVMDETKREAADKIKLDM